MKVWQRRRKFKRLVYKFLKIMLRDRVIILSRRDFGLNINIFNEKQQEAIEWKIKFKIRFLQLNFSKIFIDIHQIRK